MNQVLAHWNGMSTTDAAAAILPCCGSMAWAKKMAELRPLSSEGDLLKACDEVWWSLSESDWNEAFYSHPRIGESADSVAEHRSAEWSKDEQRRAATAGDHEKMALAEANRRYESRFGRIFIVCASGKSASQILQILNHRLANDEEVELRETAEQQQQISQIRLRKWLSS
jgi:2-oxo-4-hydroxy-4-carboxy-5-ureidoimidazoline decarboxylase